MKLHEVAESRGQQVLFFDDYMDRLSGYDDSKIVSNVRRYRKLGVALFKDGFTWDRDVTSFYKLPEEGGSWEFEIPGWRSNYELAQGYVKCICSFNKLDHVYRFEKTLSLNELEQWTLPTLKAYMQQAAKPTS